MHHPGLQHSKSTGQLDAMVISSKSLLSLPPDENGNQQQKQHQQQQQSRNKFGGSKFGLLIRTPRRRRANCLNQATSDEPTTINRLRSKSWDHQSAGMNVTNNPGKSTWSGWRSLRKISDTLIDYALNEPYKADSVFDDSLANQHSQTGVYRRRSELVVNDATVRKIEPVGPSVRGLLGSKTVGHAQGVSSDNFFLELFQLLFEIHFFDSIWNGIRLIFLFDEWLFAARQAFPGDIVESSLPPVLPTTLEDTQTSTTHTLEELLLETFFIVSLLPWPL